MGWLKNVIKHFLEGLDGITSVLAIVRPLSKVGILLQEKVFLLLRHPPGSENKGTRTRTSHGYNDTNSDTSLTTTIPSADTFISILDLTIGATTIIIIMVAVIAGFIGGRLLVTTYGVARSTFVVTIVPTFPGTGRRATITRFRVTIITLFTPGT